MSHRRAEIRDACDRIAESRARLIGAAAWYECAPLVLTREETADVTRLWHAMPGNTSWMDAFLAWMKRDITSPT